MIAGVGKVSPIVLKKLEAKRQQLENTQVEEEEEKGAKPPARATLTEKICDDCGTSWKRSHTCRKRKPALKKTIGQSKKPRKSCHPCVVSSISLPSRSTANSRPAAAQGTDASPTHSHAGTSTRSSSPLALPLPTGETNNGQAQRWSGLTAEGAALALQLQMPLINILGTALANLTSNNKQ